MKIPLVQQYMAFAALIVAVISVLYYFFALKPLNLQIVQLQGDLQTKTDKLKEVEAKIKNYAQFQKEADSVQRELEWYQNRIPKSIDKGKFMEALNGLLGRSGVVLTSFQSTTPQTLKDYSELPAVIRFHTDFNGLTTFLYQTSLSSLIMTARDITVTPIAVPDKALHPDFTLDVQMVVSAIQAKQ